MGRYLQAILTTYETAICYRFPFFFFFCSSCSNDETSQRKHVIVDIQPFAGFPNEMTQKVAIQIKNIYPHISIKPEIPLPSSSFYSPRNRYRADSPIRFLKRRTAPGHVTIGLTNKDISTTDGKIKDWGIMGLGFRPGNSCVVSSFRLNKGKVSSQFYKVCIHELGHTSGLDHCPEKNVL
ncbi:hypothetical protein [Terrimonas alba]|uniref:hypothetical protein n=1 Tax=Terrimonas alba TaxID=3349636 RepID=UPI0035F36BD9